MTQELPQVLYRYRPMRETFDFHALQEHYLYFSPPQAFNDPFEFSANESVTIPRPKQDWAAFNALNTNLLNLSRDELLKLIFERRLDGILDEQERIWREAVLDNKSDLVDKIYCCCLSKSNDHPLMWGHYADGLRGLVIGYDSELLTASSKWPASEVIRKVTYDPDNTIPQIDYTNLLCAVSGSEEYSRISRENFAKRFCTKSSHWSYEEEYRLLWQLASNDEWDQKMTYPPNSVREIVFGELMDEALRSDVVSLFEGLEVSFKLAVRSKTHYALTLEPLT